MRNTELLTFLNDTFISNFNNSIESACDVAEVVDLYHGNAWTKEELNILKERGNPEEQFNVVAMFAHQLLGYYSRTIATTKAMPRTPRDTTVANILNDIVSFDNETNDWGSEDNELKLYGMLVGYSVARVKAVKVIDSKGDVATDDYGREHVYIDKKYIHWDEVILDSSSVEADYSDGNFIHVMNWLTPSDIRVMFGGSYISKLEEVESYLTSNGSTIPYSRYTEFTKSKFNNAGKILVVHTILKDTKGKRYSIYWSGDIILSKEELEDGDTGDYVVTKIINDKHKHYSLFKSCLPSIKAINQALIQIHMLVNANKIFYVEGGIETKNNGLQKFINSVSRVNSLTKVLDLSKIKFENLTGDIVKQYTLVDKALERIQLMLGINDSFLGVAYASDSGRKVDIQRGATIMSLDYLTKRMLLCTKSIGDREFKLIQSKMIAERVLRIDDKTNEQGYKWVYANSPIRGKNNKLHIDKDNGGENLILNTSTTDLLTANVDYITRVTSYVNEAETDQMMLETVANGNAGQFLMQTSPSDYARLLAETTLRTGTRSAPKIADIFSKVADKIDDANDPTNFPEGANTEVGGQPSNSRQVQRIPNA